MNKYMPIFTRQTECQDCYKCVRSCPVKAIKIEQGVASVMDEACIYCGTCVEVCPSNAKQVRNDRQRVIDLLNTGKRVIVSLAPSWVSEFPGLSRTAMAKAFKKLGFSGVSETALGAQEVAAHVAALLSENPDKCFISSACPVVVEYICKYHPEYSQNLTALSSPLLAHCAFLRKICGEDTEIVFVGPCIAKKLESDRSNRLLHTALTFTDIHEWFEECGIDIDQPGNSGGFIPEYAAEGGLYPIDGGMIACIKNQCTVTDNHFVSLSGMDSIISVMNTLNQIPAGRGMFLETLACSGGCINGPCTRDKMATVVKRLRVLDTISQTRSNGFPRKPAIRIDRQFLPCNPEQPVYAEHQIRSVLQRTGKNSEVDELNCGGCGYNSCRELAKAILNGRAETDMCITYMRQLAQKKANMLVKTMPSAVVIVDNNMRIIESNRNFARIAGKEAEQVFEVKEGMEGAVLDKVLPISHLFRRVFETGTEIVDFDVRVGAKILRCSLFVIEPQLIAGCILNDVTKPSMKKEEIIKGARQVIKRNLTTVQKIARLLGENAAETEMTLTQIIDAFKAGNTGNQK